MASYIELYSELMGFVPKMSVQLSKIIVNRAWKDVRDSRFWSFLIGYTVLEAPGIITAGSVSVIQYATTVTLDATASAAVTGLSNPLLTLRQFRQASGAIYNIIAADFTVPAAVVLTIDQPYIEASNATASYQIYRCYYTPPSSDFKKWASVQCPAQAYTFRSVAWTRKEIDRLDPQRASQGQPYYMATYKLIKVGSDIYVPGFEMWPHPTSNFGYFAAYEKAGTDFSANADTLPPQVSRETLMYRARYLCYEWAEANKGRHQELQATNWLALRSSVNRDYEDSLKSDQRNDEETFLQNWVTHDYSNQLGPFDSSWLQSHASPFG
jgi:hypothetical protein